MAGELEHMQAALDRATKDEYHKLDPVGHGQELKALQDRRAQRKQDFSNQFLSLLHQHEMAKHSSFADVRFACIECLCTTPVEADLILLCFQGLSKYAMKAVRGCSFAIVMSCVAHSVIACTYASFCWCCYLVYLGSDWSRNLLV